MSDKAATMFFRPIPWSEANFTAVSDERRDAVQRIKSFAQFQAGWCYGRGEAFEEATTQTAIAIAGLLIATGWEPEAFPGPDGEVVITGRVEGTYLRFSVDKEREIEFEQRVGGETTEEKVLNTEEVVALILEKTSQCSSFDSFIPLGGVNAKTRGMTWPLFLQARRTEEDCPSCWFSALKTPLAEEVYADTSHITFQKDLGHRRSFGSLIPTSFQNIR